MLGCPSPLADRLPEWALWLIVWVTQISIEVSLNELVAAHIKYKQKNHDCANYSGLVDKKCHRKKYGEKQIGNYFYPPWRM